MGELRTCPFCGGEAALREWDGFGQYVRCTRCRACGPVKPLLTEAIKAWNSCVHYADEAERKVQAVDELKRLAFEVTQKYETSVKLHKKTTEILAETKRRLEAAVNDLNRMADGTPCTVCRHKSRVPCTTSQHADCFEWRGPQDEKGDRTDAEHGGERRMSMERLTGNYEPCAPGTNGCTFDKCAYTKMIARLAAYEDTGLSPEEVAELAKAKKDGRLVVLPCKVGDTVYFIKRRWDFVEERYDPPEVDEQKVECFIVDERGISGPKEWDYEGPESICGDNGQWYLTREEAEAALDKQKGD